MRADPCYVPPAGRCGLQQDGTWSTAPLKEYPARMCEAIAEAIVDSLIDRAALTPCGDGDADAIQGYRDLALPWDPYQGEDANDMHDDFDAGAAAALPYAPLRWAEAVCTVAEA